MMVKHLVSVKHSKLLFRAREMIGKIVTVSGLRLICGARPIGGADFLCEDSPDFCGVFNVVTATFKRNPILKNVFLKFRLLFMISFTSNYRGSVALSFQKMFLWIFRIICFPVRNPAFYVNGV